MWQENNKTDAVCSIPHGQSHKICLLQFKTTQKKIYVQLAAAQYSKYFSPFPQNWYVNTFSKTYHNLDLTLLIRMSVKHKNSVGVYLVNIDL